MSDIEKKQLHKEKWVVYFPDGAPYAGIRTESGVTIAGTSSGLSRQDAEEICANHEDANGAFVLIGLLAKARKERDEVKERLSAIIEQDNVEPLAWIMKFPHGVKAVWVADGNDYKKHGATPLHPPKDGTEPASKDAERYQWLRKNGCKFPDYVTGAMTEILDEEDLDAAVDFNIKEHHE